MIILNSTQSKFSCIGIVLFVLFFQFDLKAQKVGKSVLFLGNSYTHVNDLPKMIFDVARAYSRKQRTKTHSKTKL